MKKKVILDNGVDIWDSKKRYKVNQSVLFNGLSYQNITGGNSSPDSLVDWILVDEKEPISWGEIIGDLADQEDLQLALDTLQEDIDRLSGFFYGSAQPTDTPSGVDNGYWIALEAGTYTNFGGVVVDANSIAIISRDELGAFSISQTEIDLTDYLKTETLLSRTNLFDKDAVISGFYINTSTGNLDVDATSKVSSWIPVTAGVTYYLSGRNTSVPNVRYRDAVGTLIKPLTVAGATQANYGAINNRKFLTPAGAIEVQFNISFVGNGTADAVQFEVGETPTAYKPYSYIYIKPEFLGYVDSLLVPINSELTKINSILNKKSKLTLKNGADFYFSSHWDATKNLVKYVKYNVASSVNANPIVNFINEYTALKTADQSVLGTLLKTSDDDVCPFNLNGSYIAANHGWNQPLRLTKTAHGKTLADVGSTYLDSASERFTILRIVDANNIWIVSDNQAVDGITYTFISPTGDLTYQSNGTNTATITSGYTLVSVGNLYPSMSKSDVVITLDKDRIVSADGIYDCDFADIKETYIAYDLPSIIDKIILNRPGGGYLTQPNFNSLGADVLFKITNTYRFTSQGTTLIFTNFTNKKSLKFSFAGFTQNLPLTTGNLYIPKSLPIVSGATTYDFREIEDWTTPPSGTINLTSAYWENPLSPPDRIVNLNSNVIVHSGYITDRGVGLDRKDKVTNAIYLVATRKIYPMGLWNSSPLTLVANSFYSAVVFRTFRNPIDNPIGRTNYDFVDLGSEVFVFADYHGALEDKLPIDKKWLGKKISVYEKNDNITVLSDVVSGDIDLLSTATSTDYGFVVLKLT